MLRHKWVAIALFELSEEEAHRSCEEEKMVELARENLIRIVGPVCFECEIDYSKVPRDCPGMLIEAEN